MRLLFGLSNPPTKEFASTRHNVGRLFVTEHLLKKYPSNSHQHKLYTLHTFPALPHTSVCLSSTFMNLSGQPLAAYLRRNPNTKPSDLMIIHDDLEHKFGNVRIKEGGSAQYLLTVT